MKRAVELTVPATIEAVALGVTGGCGDRGAPARARELGVRGKSLGAGNLADQLRGGQRPAPALGEQLGRVAADERGELCLELADTRCAGADLAHELACDPHPRALLGACQTAGDPPEPLAGVQGPGGDLELGPQVVQVPAQPLLLAGTGRDEVLAVVDQQANVERHAVQVRSREVLDPLLQGGPGDAERVDRIGLAALPCRAPSARHVLRRDAHHPLPAREQEPLERAGDVPAVLDRPHPLAVERSRPHEQLAEASVRAGAVSSPRAAAVSASTAAQVWVFLCVSVPITIMCTVPSINRADEADSGGHVSLGANAKLLSGHAGGPRAAAGDITSVGQTTWSTESQ